MKTIKKMWAINKPMTVATLFMAIALLVLVVVMWWVPVSLGYPVYAIIGNVGLTAVYGMAVACIVSLINE